MSIRLEAATYRYAGSDAPALRSVDLELEAGRVIGVVGANGSGKSTLALVAVGLAPSAIGGTLEGTVRVDDFVTATTPAHQLAQRAGICFQDSQTQLTSSVPTVWEEVAFGPRNLSLPLDEVVDRTWRAVDALRLRPIIDRDPTRLSGGQAQLVAIASILALQPRYLVLDEPTAQLDPLGTKLVAETLAKAARDTGTGVLIVEHKTDILQRLCDEIIVLRGGEVVERGPAAEVLDDQRLSEWGVMPPARSALKNAVQAAGLAWEPAWESGL